MNEHRILKMYYACEKLLKFGGPYYMGVMTIALLDAHTNNANAQYFASGISIVFAACAISYVLVVFGTIYSVYKMYRKQGLITD